MTISINCVTAALAPFIPGPLNPIPTGLLSEWRDYERMLAKASASRFQLAEGEFPLFDGWWALSEPARRKRIEAAAETGEEIGEAFVRLAAIVDEEAVYKGETGYQHVSRVPGNGRFVIFSDHHMGFEGSRQDFFHSSGNSDLYAEILNGYADTGFTLVENGDVEELIIHEPGLPGPLADPQLRSEWRLVQLRQVIDHHRTLYKQINDQFVSEGRYVRIAGNHDQDLQDARFLDELRSVYPDLERVYDFLILEPAQDSDSTFVIGHGHHFDTASTPKYSKQIGEVLSECLGWAYEGADRVWRWAAGDGVQGWAGGTEAFANTLVTDDPDESIPLSIDVEGAFLTWLGSLGLINPFEALGGIPGIAADLTAELSKPSLWENSFHGNIAWEYFQSEDPAEGVFNEMFCGERWFKFRHLDEIFINDRLEDLFGTRVPYLVLGHSHEPRHRSWDPDGSEQADHYLNSGAAGRFENLIWGVEIIDGVAQVIAWHRPGGPDSDELPERRTYAPGVDGEGGTLIASEEHVPLPPLEEEEKKRRTWLEPVLHAMQP